MCANGATATRAHRSATEVASGRRSERSRAAHPAAQSAGAESPEKIVASDPAGALCRSDAVGEQRRFLCVRRRCAPLQQIRTIPGLSVVVTVGLGEIGRRPADGILATGSAPLARSVSETSSSPAAIARCSGVKPSRSAAFTRASLLAMRSWALAAHILPARRASCNAVAPDCRRGQRPRRRSGGRGALRGQRCRSRPPHSALASCHTHPPEPSTPRAQAAARRPSSQGRQGRQSSARTREVQRGPYTLRSGSAPACGSSAHARRASASASIAATGVPSAASGVGTCDA